MSFKRLCRQTGFGLLVSLAMMSAAAAEAAKQYYVVSVDFGTAPDNFERFKEIMNQNAKASVANETGCREFNVYEVATAANHLFLYELYDDEAAFQQHLASPHYRHFNETSAPIVTSRAVTQGTMFVSYRK